MLLDKLYNAKLIHPPKFLVPNCSYLTIMGSMSYGVSNDNSDMDIYGFCIPPKDDVFHIDEIPGFGRQKQRFDQFQQHHIKSPDSAQEYDITVYSIVKYFQLCMENNPNMIDSLFTPVRCVIHNTAVAQMVRDKRKIFLHKGSYHKFRGYAYAQMSKIKNKTNAANPKRQESIEKWGYDVKFAYHVVRLALEAEQILATGNLDLEKDREIMKSIRRGEWTIERLQSWFEEKEKALETLYSDSKLQHEPDEDEIRNLLIDCLEHHYGSLEKVVAKRQDSDKMVAEIEAVLAKYKG